MFIVYFLVKNYHNYKDYQIESYNMMIKLNRRYEKILNTPEFKSRVAEALLSVAKHMEKAKKSVRKAFIARSVSPMDTGKRCMQFSIEKNNLSIRDTSISEVFETYEDIRKELNFNNAD